MQACSIYLAGNIQKGHELTNESYWTEKEKEEIAKALDPIQPIFLDPAIRLDDLEDQKSVFGRDLLMVTTADFIFVDARERRGLGVGAEMMWAKSMTTPVLTLAPMDTHYRKEQTTILQFNVRNYTHPFVYSLSDAIVPSAYEGGVWMKEHLLTPKSIKGIEFLKETMKHFHQTHLQQDEPFQQLLDTFPHLREKIDLVMDSSSV